MRFTWNASTGSGRTTVQWISASMPRTASRTSSNTGWSASEPDSSEAALCRGSDGGNARTLRRHRLPDGGPSWLPARGADSLGAREHDPGHSAKALDRIGYQRLGELSEEHHHALWGVQEYYRAFSLVNGGRRRETDLFEGLR